MDTDSEELDMPPSDIYLEVMAGFLLVVIGQLSTFKLKPVRYGRDTNTKRWDESYGAPDFKSFTSRAKALHKRKSSST